MQRDIGQEQSAARAVAEPRTAGRGRHARLSQPYDMLAEHEVDVLIAAACSLLRDRGCHFEPGTEAIELLQRADCRVDAGGLVHFDPAMVRECIATCAKSARLWNRAGDEFIELDSSHTWFMPGMACIQMVDHQSGAVRPSTAADLALIARVADALPNMDAVSVACKDMAHLDVEGEINEFAVLIQNTAKPLEYLCEHAESLRVAIEMAVAVRGSRALLREKPYFLQIVTPASLSFARAHIDQVILGARAGVPVSVGTMPLPDAATPISIHSCLVHTLATDFAGMVLGQLARRGAFIVGSSDVSFMQPVNAGISNFAHAALADAIAHQVRRRMGLPSFTGFAGMAVARRLNQDAIWEISASMMQAFFSRPATLDFLGSLDSGNAFSLHALCLCDQLAGLLRSMWQGIPADSESVALDVASAVGPGTHDLVTPSGGSSELIADKDLLQRLDEDLRHILATHQVARPDSALLAQLDQIQRRGTEPRSTA